MAADGSPIAGGIGPVVLAGHPFAPIGIGEAMRSHIRACRAVGLDTRVLDIFGNAAREDPEHVALIEPIETRTLGDGVRVFHVNGDEVDRVQAALFARGENWGGGRNIIVPAWELPRFPAPWARALRRFDAVWAISRFVADALRDAGIETTYVGQSVEMPPGALLPRRFFGMRESAFALLAFCDLGSFPDRKNPDGALALFAALRARAPFADIQLVLKVKRHEAGAEDWAAPVAAAHPEALVLSRPFDGLATRSLLAAADCFVSLHRAEGFGRGTAEAMGLGRLALATGWSGNLDHMTAENALLVRHRLVPVPRGAYPHAARQSWAEPDIDHAVALVEAALADPEAARARAWRGRQDVRRRFSDRATGLRILDAIRSLTRGDAGDPPPPRPRRDRGGSPPP